MDMEFTHRQAMILWLLVYTGEFVTCLDLLGVHSMSEVSAFMRVWADALDSE